MWSSILVESRLLLSVLQEHDSEKIPELSLDEDDSSSSVRWRIGGLFLMSHGSFVNVVVILCFFGSVLWRDIKLRIIRGARGEHLDILNKNYFTKRVIMSTSHKENVKSTSHREANTLLSSIHSEDQPLLPE